MVGTKRLQSEWDRYYLRVHRETKRAPLTMRDIENAFYAGGLSSLLAVAREKEKGAQAEQLAAIEIFEEVAVKISSFE